MRLTFFDKKLFVFVLAILILVFPALTASAETLTDGVSILNPKQNIHGIGYEWDNPHDVLTLTNLSIDTDDDFGLKVPDGATVILNGVNRISAKVAALYIGGRVTIKGDGRLILNGGEYGVFCNSSDKRTKLSIISGVYEISAGKSGFYSAVEKISVSGKAEITVSGGKYSFETLDLEITNGATVNAVGQISASASCLISAVNLNVTAPDRAVVSPSLVIERVSVDAGDNHDTEYVSQSKLITVSEWKYVRTSVIFGDGVPAYVDLIAALGAAALAALAIVLPIVIRKRKLRRIEEARKSG
ncbi:MAG: hypothetical protein IKX86_01345 [Clostridia bacterium]|nr:hypothetical protein [Clostridia bacterium]